MHGVALHAGSGVVDGLGMASEDQTHGVLGSELEELRNRVARRRRRLGASAMLPPRRTRREEVDGAPRRRVVTTRSGVDRVLALVSSPLRHPGGTDGPLRKAAPAGADAF